MIYWIFIQANEAHEITRDHCLIGNEENEGYLLGITKHGTAHHVEKLVSLYRGCKRRQDNDAANKAHEKRELQCHYDTDGCLVIHGRIPAEQGALIRKALDRAMEQNDQPKPHHQDVPRGRRQNPSTPKELTPWRNSRKPTWRPSKPRPQRPTATR